MLPTWFQKKFMNKMCLNHTYNNVGNRHYGPWIAILFLCRNKTISIWLFYNIWIVSKYNNYDNCISLLVLKNHILVCHSPYHLLDTVWIKWDMIWTFIMGKRGLGNGSVHYDGLLGISYRTSILLVYIKVPRT